MAVHGYGARTIPTRATRLRTVALLRKQRERRADLALHVVGLFTGSLGRALGLVAPVTQGKQGLDEFVVGRSLLCWSGRRAHLSHKRFFLNLVLKFQQDSLGQLRADAGRASQHPGILGENGGPDGVLTKLPDQGHRCLRSAAGDALEQIEQAALERLGKTVEGDGVLAEGLPGQKNDLGPKKEQSGNGFRYLNVVADASAFHERPAALDLD